MAYEYRNFSPEEQDAIKRQRPERGYPMHGPPHPYRDAGYYMITAANYEHRAVMASTARRTDFELQMLTALENFHGDIFGSPYEWPWSSVHKYLEAFGRTWLRTTWQAHHPGNFGKGWDDNPNRTSP